MKGITMNLNYKAMAGEIVDLVHNKSWPEAEAFEEVCKDNNVQGVHRNILWGEVMKALERAKTAKQDAPKSETQQIEEDGISKHLPTDPYSNIFREGLMIWRPVAFNDYYGNRIEEINFVKTERGSWMAKVRLDSSLGFCSELSVVDHTIHGREVAGITVFVKGEPPKNWTHLIVTGVSRHFKMTSEKVGNGDKQGAIFAEFGKPYDVKDYLRFRQALRQKHTGLYYASLREKVAIYEQIWPDEERSGTLRCILHHSEDEGVLWEYYHMVEADVSEDPVDVDDLQVEQVEDGATSLVSVVVGA